MAKQTKDSQPIDAPFEYVFPAIKGIQAGREYYVSMCPLRLIPKIFLFDEEELVPELRAQRTLNKGRLPEMSRYMLENPEGYIFSALTASIDAEVRFKPLADAGSAERIGLLHIPMEARFIINDGQHRRAAIEMALRENPELGDESIAVVFFLDVGLERSQQMFADLNRYAIRPSRSLGVLYDHRDARSQIAKLVAMKSTAFAKLVEMEKSTLATRSRKLFTLSAIFSATSALLDRIDVETTDEAANLAIEFWDAVGKAIVEWTRVRQGKVSAGEIRQDFVHSHSIGLQAIARVGNHLLRENGTGWKRSVTRLKGLDWSRANTSLWEGRAMIGGRMSKAGNNVTLTTNAIKKHLRLTLSPEERRVEQAFGKGGHGKRERSQET